jgi:F0F1-type ATP synthase beta subunit
MPARAKEPEMVPADAPADGFDAQVALDPERGRRGLWPAIDTQHTVAARYLDERHRDLADRSRAALRAGDDLAERIHAYLTHPLRVSEPFLGTPAQAVALRDALDDIDALLAGVHRDTPPKEQLYLGRLPAAG